MIPIPASGSLPASAAAPSAVVCAAPWQTIATRTIGQGLSLLRDIAAAPTLRARTIATRTSRARAALAAATEKIARYLTDLSLLGEEDWAVLSPLALRLSDLVRQVGRASDAARTADSPDA